MVEVRHLKSIPFFNCLKDDILEQLSQIATIRKYVNSDILFYEKDTQDVIFYLVSGAIKFYKVDRFDNEIFLYKITSDSIIFDIAKICDEHILSCYANAEFLEDSTILIFNGVKFRELMKINRDFMSVVLRESFKMIQQLQCIISRDIVFDATAKVAHMLIDNLNNFNSLKKHEIAYMLHIQPETLSRILKKLTRNKIISIEKNYIKISNIDKLKEICE
ncbi:MAG: Crp/Fnr family transcriptional regulator [Sulfurospirillum sp.]|nr:Crp/Fnr family transcriptional regulator [Sulfurospirillum sp.]MBL0703329.1 Crp/Fnr family transcriptional regulator [Sulfurospirillum sp.]